jgi:hypothetical protein
VHVVLLLVLLQIGDVISTNIALARPGAAETNPVLILAVAYLGTFWWLPKLIILVPIALGIRAGGLRGRREQIAMGAAVVLYAVVIANNLIGAF